MKDLNLEEISRLVSQKTGQTVVFTNCEETGGGFHSIGYKLTSKGGRNFFLKRVHTQGLGLERPERKIFSLLTSDVMAKRAGLAPHPVGLIIKEQEAVFMPELNEHTEVFHIQEFEPTAESYWSRLQRRKKEGKQKMDEADIRELTEVLRIITHIHAHKYPKDDIEEQKAVYNDGLRNVINNPETTFALLQELSETHPILPRKLHGEYIRHMIDIMHSRENRYHRLVALHGDFWGANLFYRPDGSAWLIDYSRVPWGDAGVDVGWWLSQYLWAYHETGNSYFKELGEWWLNAYEEKTGDKEIRRAVAYIHGVIALIMLTGYFNPDENFKGTQSYMNTVWEILRRNKFMWEV